MEAQLCLKRSRYCERTDAFVFSASHHPTLAIIGVGNVAT